MTQKPNFVFVVVRMKQPFGVLFLQKPTRDQILETIASLLQEGDHELDKCFETIEFDITEDVEGAFAE